MTTDPARPEVGELFEWHAVVEDLQIEVLAEVEVSGATLHFRDIAIFPVGVEHADVGCARWCVPPARSCSRTSVRPASPGCGSLEPASRAPAPGVSWT